MIALGLEKNLRFHTMIFLITEKGKKEEENRGASVLVNKIELSDLSNRPFYSCVLSCQVLFGVRLKVTLL